MDTIKYVLLASNDMGQVQAFGNYTGRLWLSEKSAERSAKKMEDKYPHLSVLVLPINQMPEE